MSQPMNQWASQAAQMVNNLSAMWETWVQFLSQEDPLEKDMATHCSILAWNIPWTEEPGRLQSMGSQRVRHNWVTNTALMNQYWCISAFFISNFFKKIFYVDHIFKLIESVTIMLLGLCFAFLATRHQGS